MQGADRVVRFHRDDRKGEDGLRSCSRPTLPQSGERQRSSGRVVDPIRDLSRRLLRPLVEAVCRHQTSPSDYGLLECRLASKRLGSGVDHAGPDGNVLGPRRHKTPAHRTHPGALSIRGHHGGLLRGSDVVAGLVIEGHRRNVENLYQVVHRCGQAITTAHVPVFLLSGVLSTTIHDQPIPLFRLLPIAQ